MLEEEEENADDENDEDEEGVLGGEGAVEPNDGD
jgi:hypothetical protein